MEPLIPDCPSLKLAYLMQNDTSLEERVQALEFQMENVHEDMTVIEGEISVINTEQDLQDTQLQIIEEDVQNGNGCYR